MSRAVGDDPALAAGASAADTPAGLDNLTDGQRKRRLGSFPPLSPVRERRG